MTNKNVIKSVKQNLQSNEKKVRQSRIKVAPLSVSLMAVFEPLLAQLDENPNYLSSGEADSGQERPADGGIRVLLGMMAQNLHTQCYGPIITRNGNIDSAKDRMDKSHSDWQAHVERYSEDRDAMSTDPRTYTLGHWRLVNERRFEAYTEILDAVKDVYLNIIGEDWVPRETNNTSSASTVRKVKLDAETEQKYKDMIKKLEGGPNGTKRKAA